MNNYFAIFREKDCGLTRIKNVTHIYVSCGKKKLNFNLRFILLLQFYLQFASSLNFVYKFLSNFQLKSLKLRIVKLSLCITYFYIDMKNYFLVEKNLSESKVPHIHVLYSSKNINYSDIFIMYVTLNTERRLRFYIVFV